MKHNEFRFTIKVNIPDGTPRALIEEYVEACCDTMPQPCCKVIEILTTYYRDDEYLVYLKMQVKDYEVPEVGIDIVAAWIEIMYNHCVDFTIDTMIIHPQADVPANGAIIKWDHINNCLIIQTLTE